MARETRSGLDLADYFSAVFARMYTIPRLTVLLGYALCPVHATNGASRLSFLTNTPLTSFPYYGHRSIGMTLRMASVFRFSEAVASNAYYNYRHTFI